MKIWNVLLVSPVVQKVPSLDFEPEDQLLAHGDFCSKFGVIILFYCDTELWNMNGMVMH